MGDKRQNTDEMGESDRSKSSDGSGEKCRNSFNNHTKSRLVRFWINCLHSHLQYVSKKRFEERNEKGGMRREWEKVSICQIPRCKSSASQRATAKVKIHPRNWPLYNSYAHKWKANSNEKEMDQDWPQEIRRFLLQDTSLVSSKFSFYSVVLSSGPQLRPTGCFALINQTNIFVNFKKKKRKKKRKKNCYHFHNKLFCLWNIENQIDSLQLSHRDWIANRSSMIWDFVNWKRGAVSFGIKKRRFLLVERLKNGGCGIKNQLSMKQLRKI